jgi:hypothetical protein
MTNEGESGVGSKRSFTSTTGQSSNFIYNTPLVIEDLQHERIMFKSRPQSGMAYGPYEFELPAENDTFLDMGSIGCYMRCKIKRGDGTEMTDEDIVAPVNLLASSMWMRVEVIINDSSSNKSSADHYNYKSYLETILSYEGDARETHLRTQLYYQDTPGRLETFKKQPVGDEKHTFNAGFDWRYEKVKKSQTFDLYAPISTDILRSSKHLAPGNKLILRLTKAPDEWLLNSTDSVTKFKLEFVDLFIEYNRIRLNPHTKMEPLQIYPFSKTEMKKYAIPAGLYNYRLRMQTGGVIPKQVIFFQVDTSAAEGHYSKNPLNFKHFNLSYHDIRPGGYIYPIDGLQPDFSNDPPLMSRELVHLYKNTGVYRTDRGCCVSYSGFPNGYTILAHDLTPDMCNSHHIHKQKTGSLEAEFKWKTGLAEPISIYALCVYDAVYVHDAERKTFELSYL